MTFQQILIEIPRLSFQQHMILLEAIISSLRDSTRSEQGELHTLVDDLFGAFNPTRRQYSDDDIERIRFEALHEKYS